MRWLKKVFGSGTSSGGGDGGVVALRSTDKRRMARDAAKGLGASDENAARSLCRLASESQKMGDSKYNEMTRVGEQLYARGACPDATGLLSGEGSRRIVDVRKHGLERCRRVDGPTSKRLVLHRIESGLWRNTFLNERMQSSL
jgi:hypothetical protein